MPVNKKLKSVIASYLLSRELKQCKRKGISVSLQAATTIGIVYDSTHEKVYELIKKTVKDIRTLQKDVLALGYYDKKELPPMRFSKLGMDFFTRKSLNWQLKPSGTVVANFMALPFDILIILNSEHIIPIRYIAAHSKARFKIGKFDPRNEHVCDMMIDTGEDPSTQKLLEQILKYLNMIKNEYQKV
jgi:hypothetical protein